ncbi:hypothetical protein [Roseicyclus marinus]|uniref:hypothetical protein n=1 Tax=Roseicyclus marinus TaxID=2161673 RepID=UPI00241086D0|nr:hypothetical protein [Roseicyclus marinus]MDG3041328.1 hypothetical protein [Roseicyclus marinus]
MIRSALLAAILATTALPAAAGGTLSLSLTPGSGAQADLLRAGFAIYRIARGIESGAFVHQDGSQNGAALRQIAGSGSQGIIHQEGNGHSAMLDQQGYGQSHGVFQFGNGARANVAQTRNGQAGLTFQFGFD